MREINIGAGSLSRPIENVVATMQHEMVHYYNDQHGIKDCSRGNTYHNRKFKERAEKCGLHIEHHPTYGWSITTQTDEMVEFCLENTLAEIRLCRNDGFAISIPGTGTHAGTSAGTGRQKPSSTRKYICPCCGLSVRATKEVNVGCLDCSEKMIPAA